MLKQGTKFFLLLLIFWIGWLSVVRADFAISVDKIGTGIGTVSATSDGNTFSGTINCGTFCAASFPQVVGANNQPRNVNVSFTAIPSAGSVFIGWFDEFGNSWANCGTRISCSVLATANDQRITAKFDLGVTVVSPVPVTVLNGGSGSDYGSVVSTPVGITCNGKNFTTGQNIDCTQQFAPGTGVTLNADVNKANGAFFAGWEVSFQVGGAYVPQPNMCQNLEPSCFVTVPFNVSDIRVNAKFDLTFILTTQRQGDGAGSLFVSSTNFQSTCLDSSCQQTFDKDRMVTITANTTASSKFSGWTVDGSTCLLSTSAPFTCTVKMDKAHRVIGTFDKVVIPSPTPNYSASVVKEGSGTYYGVVKGIGGLTDIFCGGSKNDCSVDAKKSTSITFTASLDDPATPREEDPHITELRFAGWKVRFWDPVDLKWVDYPNICTGLQPTCVITVTQEVQVMARFDYDIRLTVVRDGNGQGKINTSSQPLNLCTVEGTKSICDQTFVRDQVVTLAAIAEPKSRFIKWIGCDKDKDKDNPSDVLPTLKDTNLDGSDDTCTLKMGKSKTVTATFEAIDSAKLTVLKDGAGSGTGTVTSDILGLNCGTICSRNYAFDTEVVLTAVSDEGSEFVGWSGDWCSGLQPTCKVSMSQAKDVTARFDSGFKLTLIKQGTGEGAVTSSPNGINCGANCSFSFTNSTTVTLTAKTGEGTTFLGWGGACTGTQLTCSVPMTKAQTVTVTFSGVGLGKALDYSASLWASGGDAPWVGESTVVYYGDAALMSGGIKPNQQSWLQTTVTGPGELSFYWKVSSEVDQDKLVFTATGATGIVSSISGEVEWKQVKYNLAAGSYVLKWTYSKDGDITVGRDTAWLDRVQFIAPTGGSTSNGNGSGSVVDAAAFHLGLLNDTGIDWCANKSSNFLNNKGVQCDALLTSFPGQDGQVGRDAFARQAKLFKIGRGDAGFDYTKICNSGLAAGVSDGVNSCPAEPVVGDAPSQWGCTRDNVTGLLWEVKTQGGLRDKDTIYSWYDSNDRTNGGAKGDSCTSIVCNTDSYVQAVNQASLCNATDWRLPTRKELHSLVHQGRSSPSIDVAFFPNTAAFSYWSATAVAATPFNAWYVNFDSGWDFWDNKASKQRIRLVRKCDNCQLATQQTVTPTPKYQDKQLHLPQVNVGNVYYDATLNLDNSTEPMVFKLMDANVVNAPIARSLNADQMVYYVDGALKGLLVLNNVEVGSQVYNARLQLVLGSNPLRFVLQDAQLVR